MRLSNTMSLVPFTCPRFLKLTERTGGIKLLTGDGRISSFNFERESPVQRQSVPDFGRRINSGCGICSAARA